MEADQNPLSKYINKITIDYVNCYKRNKQGQRKRTRGRGRKDLVYIDDIEKIEVRREGWKRN